MVSAQPEKRRTEWPDGTETEFPGEEVELKFQFVELPTPDVLNTIVETLRGGMPLTLLDRYRIDGRVLEYEYFAARHDGFVESAFLIFHEPSTYKRVIKRKKQSAHYVLSGPGSAVTVLRSREEIVEGWHELASDEIDEIVHSASKRLRAEVIRLQRLTRTVYRHVCQNDVSARAYEIVVDYADVGDYRMCQLEIEYKWAWPERTPDFGSINAVVRELAQMSERLQVSPIAHMIVPTTMTKFEWLVSIQTMARPTER